MATGSAEKFIEKSLVAYIELGGELVEAYEFQRRLSICQGCEHAGEVEPVKGVKMEGCKICSCPFKTKLRAKTYFSISKLKVVTAECPHPEGNRWEANH